MLAVLGIDIYMSMVLGVMNAEIESATSGCFLLCNMRVDQLTFGHSPL